MNRFVDDSDCDFGFGFIKNSGFSSSKLQLLQHFPYKMGSDSAGFRLFHDFQVGSGNLVTPVFNSNTRLNRFRHQLRQHFSDSGSLNSPTCTATPLTKLGINYSEFSSDFRRISFWRSSKSHQFSQNTRLYDSDSKEVETKRTLYPNLTIITKIKTTKRKS